ncbi:uncharacterized protein LOC34624251 [Cyclospora cayetanensis]|uniref:Uncharacterized protein LOC34624251 n=1 Tax=Cyclospora cayetanensis TaxID=88456 RepID=A0A6P6RU22_9EIME|nr:uncharacterized protein LOC34624251 [Cyclospora cayetanensis]
MAMTSDPYAGAHAPAAAAIRPAAAAPAAAPGVFSKPRHAPPPDSVDSRRAPAFRCVSAETCGGSPSGFGTGCDETFASTGKPSPNAAAGVLIVTADPTAATNARHASRVDAVQPLTPPAGAELPWHALVHAETGLNQPCFSAGAAPASCSPQAVPSSPPARLRVPPSRLLAGQGKAPTGGPLPERGSVSRAPKEETPPRPSSAGAPPSPSLETGAPRNAAEARSPSPPRGGGPPGAEALEADEPGKSPSVTSESASEGSCSNEEELLAAAAAAAAAIPAKTAAELLRAPVLPLRIEGMHAVGAPQLLQSRRHAQRFECPLCAPAAWTPDLYLRNYKHYVSYHWRRRRYLGAFVCFPCRLGPQQAEGPYSGGAPGGGPRRGALPAPLCHYHCAICPYVDSSFSSLKRHVKQVHPGSAADPKLAALRQDFQTPACDPRADYWIELVPAPLEERFPDSGSLEGVSRGSDSSEGLLPLEKRARGMRCCAATQRAESVALLEEAARHSLPQAETADGCNLADGLLRLESGEGDDASEQSRRRVAFGRRVRVRLVDKEISIMEQLGAMMGPVFGSVLTRDAVEGPQPQRGGPPPSMRPLTAPAEDFSSRILAEPLAPGGGAPSPSASSAALRVPPRKKHRTNSRLPGAERDGVDGEVQTVQLLPGSKCDAGGRKGEITGSVAGRRGPSGRGGRKGGGVEAPAEGGEKGGSVGIWAGGRVAPTATQEAERAAT